MEKALILVAFLPYAGDLLWNFCNKWNSVVEHLSYLFIKVRVAHMGEGGLLLALAHVPDTASIRFANSKSAFVA